MMYFYATVLSNENGIPTYTKKLGEYTCKSNAIIYLNNVGIILSFIELTKEEHDEIKKNIAIEVKQ